jgi:hypothetical protein
MIAFHLRWHFPRRQGHIEIRLLPSTWLTSHAQPTDSWWRRHFQWFHIRNNFQTNTQVRAMGLDAVFAKIHGN